MIGEGAMRIPSAMIVVMLLVGCAAGPDAVLPEPDPPGLWRTMALEDSATTSRCIGSRATPLCAVETILACQERHDLELCRSVFTRPGHFHDKYFGSTPTRHHRRFYRIVFSQRIAQDEDIPEEGSIDYLRRKPEYRSDPSYLDWAWRIGDVEIDIYDENCWHDKEKVWRCTVVDSRRPKKFCVRLGEDGWRVVDWFKVIPENRFEE